MERALLVFLSEDAKRVGLTKAQIERMTSAFDHDELRAALAL